MSMTRLERAKALRKEMTPPERALWKVLAAKRLEGVKFKRQQPVGPFIVDFISFERNLIIEIDGGQHDEDVTRSHDQIHTRWLETQGFQIIRFWNNDVLANLAGVVTRIKEML